MHSFYSWFGSIGTSNALLLWLCLSFGTMAGEEEDQEEKENNWIAEQ